MRSKIDLPKLTHHFLLLNTLPILAGALNCDKTFTYYEDYGQNSFNVSCSGITKGYEHILENITINNEISLTISDSVLEHVTPDLFKNVRNIKILKLFNSTFEFDQKLAIFSKLARLEVLVVQNTHFDIENKTLQGLTNLKRLKLMNNSISAVQKGGFKDLINLEKLELVDNHIRNLEDLQLCELKKLKSLSLRRNLLSSLRSFYFFCLKHPNSLDLNVNSQPALPNIYHESYYNVHTVSYDLVDLDLSFNQIVDLSYSLEDTDKLRLLNLGYNKLTSVKNSNFKSLLRLQKLILSHNELRSFDSRIFVNRSQLSFVDLSYNYLSTFTASDVPELQYLDLSYNNLSTVFIKSLKKLKKLNLGCNRLNKLSANNFQDVPNIASLNLAGNHLDLSYALFENLHELKYLSLRNNSLSIVPEKVFVGLKNLKALDMSANNIQILNANTFHDLENLETLNLSSNSIRSLSYLVVEPLKSLRTLDIAVNQLLYIEYDVILSKLPGLSNINIKANLLTCENLEKIIEFLKQKHIVYTNSEHLDYNGLSQNVAGIPCKPDMAASDKLMVRAEERPISNGPLYNFGIFLIVVLVSIITGIVSYRFYVYLKRRRYRADEFELVVE